MTEQALSIFKLLLLGGLYAFFARVLWAVWSEVRPGQPAAAQQQNDAAGHAPHSVAADAPARQAPRAMRIVEPLPLANRIHTLDSALTVGRDPSNRLVMGDDGYVSGFHARIVSASGSVSVTDLGSTNGTLVNGTKIDKITTLAVGDVVQIGTLILEAQS